MVILTLQCEEDTIPGIDPGTIMCCKEGMFFDMTRLTCMPNDKMPEDLDCLPDSEVPDDLCPKNRTIYGEI